MRSALLVAFLIFLVTPFAAPAQTPVWSGVVASSRAEDWSGAGVTGGIPSGSWTQCGSTLAAGATIATINAAIAACPANHYVQLAAGTFNLTSGLLWSTGTNSVAVRGMGANQTFLVFSGNNSCQGLYTLICMQSSDTNYNLGPSNTATWSAGYSVGTTSITLSSVTNLSVGWPIMLDQLDDTSDSGGVYICSTSTCALNGDGGMPRPGRGQEQMVTVTSISGSSGAYTVGITPALIMPNWRSSQTPQAWWATGPIFTDGIENLSISTSSSGATSNVGFFNCDGCWASGIRTVGPPGRSHIAIKWSNHVTVQNSYLYQTNTAASVNYGIEVSPGSDCLIQNNIFEQIQAPYPADGSATGCVFAYNFDVNNVFANTNGNPNFLNQSGFPHAVGDEHMLYEGNIGAGLYSDNFHGTHHFITIFRNAYGGFQQNQGFIPNGGIGPIILPSYSRFYNVIGNVLGSPVLPYNYYEDSTSDTTGEWPIYMIGLTTASPVPNDPNTTTTLMRWGNYDSETATTRFVSTEVPSALTGAQAPFANPVPASNNLPGSFYMSTKPSWWPSTKPWPPIGPDVTGGNVSICNGGTDTAAYVTSSSMCTGGSLATMGTHINSNPAMDCYYSMGGNPIGTGAVLSFNASTCYVQTVAVEPPQPPTNLSATVN